MFPVCIPRFGHEISKSRTTHSSVSSLDQGGLEEQSLSEDRHNTPEHAILQGLSQARLTGGARNSRSHASSIHYEPFSDFDWSFDSASDNSSSATQPWDEELTKPARLLRVDSTSLSLESRWMLAALEPLHCGWRIFDDDRKDGTENTLGTHLETSDRRIATKGQIDALATAYPLPALPKAKWTQDLTYIYWSAHQRLWALVVLVNIALIAVIISQPSLVGNFDYHQASTAMGSNFLIAALGRQEHVINLLFRILCLLPRSTPLTIRRQVAHLYTYGGLHAGCGISAFLWYVLFTILLIKQFEGPYAASVALGPTTAMIFAILLLVLVMSLPGIRSRWRDQWELSHRYGGWTAILLSWAQTLIVIVSQAERAHRLVTYELIRAPTFWILSLISMCLIYPWVRLRRRSVEAEVLSKDAVRLWFNDCKLPSCVGFNLSHSPLIQNHTFATIPNNDSETGYSIVVSNAGDWTKALIDDPPKRIWTRGAPTIGVLRIATLFRPVVLVATGPGIGPCLSFLQESSEYPLRIMWITQSPETTYGRRIIDEVLRADHHAVIIDTEKTGEPDVMALAYALYHETGAEAIAVVNSANATRQLVYEMEARGVAAFGPVF